MELSVNGAALLRLYCMLLQLLQLLLSDRRNKTQADAMNPQDTGDGAELVKLSCCAGRAGRAEPASRFRQTQ